MLELLKSLFSSTSALISIIIGILTIIIIFRRKQLLKPPKLYFAVGPPLPDEVLKNKKFLEKSPLNLIFIDNIDNSTIPAIGVLLMALKCKGREPIRKIRLQIELLRDYLVDNEEYKSIINFEPYVESVLDNPQYVKVGQPLIKKKDLKNLDQHREVNVSPDKAIVSYEVPILRPDEGIIIPEPIRLGEKGISNITELGFGNFGFENIVLKLSKITKLKSFFVANTWIFAENHETKNNKIKIFRIEKSSDVELQNLLVEISKAFWLGSHPAPGFYFPNPFSVNHEKKLNFKYQIYSYELGWIIFSEFIELKTKLKSKYFALKSEDSAVEGIKIGMPNCNYCDIPSSVNSLKQLLNWMGFSANPIFARKK